ncbi:putative reverse transcriptase domain, ribonuclease H-like domain, aspartic peptidase domain protein [Tanacetum coccineum]
MDAEHGSGNQKSPEKSPEKVVEEEIDTQEELKESVKEPRAKRKKSIPRKSTRKRQKLEEDAEKEELKGFLDIVPREEVPIEVESISTKFPIVDWKTYVLTETLMYYQVFRRDGSSKNYKILSEMLEDFDRLDVEELYRLVKNREEISFKPRDDFQDAEEEIRASNEELEALMEDQPLPIDASPTSLIADFNPEEDPADHHVDGGDNDDNESSDDDNDDDDVVKDTETFETDKYAFTPPTSPYHTLRSPSAKACVTKFAAALPSSLPPPPENIKSLKDNIREMMTTVNQGMSVEEIKRVVAQRVANAIEAITIYKTKTNMARKSMSQTERQEDKVAENASNKKKWEVKFQKRVDMIHGGVMASKPKTMQDAIEFVTKLMNKKISTPTECQAGNKMKLDNTSKNNQNQQQPNKRQNTGRAYIAGHGEKKHYGRSKLLCSKCNYHHDGLCAPKCHKCNRVGHLACDCRSSTNANTANNQRGTKASQKATCYECGNQGHYRNDCREQKNQNHENKSGGTGACGVVHAFGGGETKQDLNNIEDEIDA